jgi:hypothetical protein
MTEKCMKCRKDAGGSIPICPTCRVEMKDFQKLADFLNKFDGKKEDALWLISSEISDRQSMIINSCKIVHDLEGGGIRLEAPNGKPFVQQKVEEIEKLYKAKSILKEHYGI